jgi:hypothetical protein
MDRLYMCNVCKQFFDCPDDQTSSCPRCTALYANEGGGPFVAGLPLGELNGMKDLIIEQAAKIEALTIRVEELEGGIGGIL